MNSIVFLLFTAVLSAAALFVVAFPILSKAGAAQPATSTAAETLDELLAQRDAALQALRELNFDRQVGKVTAEDFGVFEGNLKRIAADRLRALDAWEAQSDKLLEGAVASRRASLKAGGACLGCGRPVAATDKFCTGCGASLPEGPVEAKAAGCSQCGRPYEPGDRFCASCGAPL